MNRRTKHAIDTKQETDWIFKIDIELNVNSKPKIAFLSGLERTYYPEDPGHSKFGLFYQTSTGFGDETPPCTFLPQQENFKPISNKCYSIGGFGGPRFAFNKISENPSPDLYQPEVIRPLLKSKNRRRPLAEEEDVFKFGPNDPFVIRNQQRLLDQRNLQCYVSFGSFKTNPRFDNSSTLKTAGVGTYNIVPKKAPTSRIKPSFGSSPIIREESTALKCVFDKPESCIDCGQIFHMSDFYRTRFSVRVPMPETRTLTEQEQKNFPKGMKYVNLCNYCYYRATKGQSNNWPKNKLKWIFKKTRTCVFIHDHQGLSEVIHKVDCKAVRKLQRKEAILSKYYEDRVEDSLQPEDY